MIKYYISFTENEYNSFSENEKIAFGEYLKKEAKGKYQVYRDVLPVYITATANNIGEQDLCSPNNIELANIGSLITFQYEFTESFAAESINFVDEYRSKIEHPELQKIQKEYFNIIKNMKLNILAWEVLFRTIDIEESKIDIDNIDKFYGYMSKLSEGIKNSFDNIRKIIKN